MDEKYRDYIIQEGNILQKLQHKNIISFKRFMFDRTDAYLIMENAEGGDLDKKIKLQRKKGYFSEERIITWFLDICQAIKYIHDKQILHRDLKPKNIFLTKDEVIKLGDFGISKVLNSLKDKTNTCVGTDLYMSPEVIKDNESYSFSCDIWSLGIIL